MMNIKSLLLFWAASGAVFLSAAEYFVSNSGSNANPGSKEKPFLTIQYGVDKAQPGDVVTVRGGTYREQIKIKNSGLPGKPITLRGAEGETALLTAGFAVKTPWKRNAQYKSVWESFSPYSVNMLWESKRVARYLEVSDLAWLARQPGSFLLDKSNGKLYIHTFGGESPNELGIVVVPYYTGRTQAGFSGGTTGNYPAPYSHDVTGVYRLNKGIFTAKSHLIIENFHLTWWPGQAIRINNPSDDVIVRNNYVTGGTCGPMTYGPVTNVKLIDNYVRRVAGIGIFFQGGGKNLLSARNTIINCGTCPPFKDDITGSSGHVYSMAHYGGKVEFLDFVDNTVISTDPVRNNGWRIMRCKGGIGKHTLQRGNVLWGGGVDLYAASNSKATIANNTIWGGNGGYGVGSLSTGEKYEPDFKDNLFLRSGTKDPGFADTAYYDFRLRPDSQAIGKGAFPQPGKVLYVNSAKNGDGSTPDKALSSLAQALQQAASAHYTIYLAPGTYSGRASFNGKQLTLRALGKGHVVLKNVHLNLKGAVTAEEIIFEEGKISSTGKLQLLHCAVSSGVISAKTLLFKESVTAGQGRFLAPRLVMQNSIVDGNGVSFVADSVLSEHNLFTSETVLKNFQQHVSEAHKSFYAPVKLNAAYQLPADSPLTSAGLDAQCIGGRKAPEAVRKFTVENLKATAIAADTLRLEWNTPLDYCSVSIRGYEVGSKPRKNVPALSFQQGELQQTDGMRFMRGLTPGKTYALQFYFYRPGIRKPHQENLTAKLPASFPHTPVTLNVGKNSPYKTLAAALYEARKGDTILIEPGTYTGRVQLGADNLTIKSTVPGGAKLNAGGLLNCTMDAGGTRNLTLDGLFFVGNRYSASAQALAASGAKNLTVRNCRFDRKRPRGCANVHFYAHGLDGLLMENCVFDAGFHGVWTIHSNNMIFRNNTFFGQGINGIHAGIIKGGKAEIYNNIFMDTVSNHTSPAVSVTFPDAVVCDYNLYWKAKTNQQCFGFGIYKNGVYSAPWSVLKKDMEPTVKAANKRFGVESHGLEADPLFADTAKADFSLKPGSPALKRGKNGKNIGADFSVFCK